MCNCCSLEYLSIKHGYICRNTRYLSLDALIEYDKEKINVAVVWNQIKELKFFLYYFSIFLLILRTDDILEYITNFEMNAGFYT